MCKPPEILSRCRAVGISLRRDGDRIAIRPAGHCPPELFEAIQKHKPELLRELSRDDCRGSGEIPPDDLPLIPSMPKPTPDERARVIEAMLRQGCDKPGPLTAWLVRRETAYYDGPGRHWDCDLFSYAAARDALCWQAGKAEGELRESKTRERV